MFHRLTSSPVGTEISFVLDEQRFAALFLAGYKLEARAASITIVTQLEHLAGATVAVAKKPVAPGAAKKFVSVASPAQATRGGDGPLREFEFGSVLHAPPDDAGVASSIVGMYFVKIETAGALAGAAANIVNAKAVHDIVLRVGYRLAAPPVN